MTTGTLSEYAAHINASPAYVTKLKNQNRLVFKQDGVRSVVDFELSDRLVSNTGDSGRANNGLNSKPNADAPIVSGTNAQVDQVFRKAKAQEMAYAAKITELDYKERSGNLIQVAAVRSVLATAFSTTRTRLMQIPARLASTLCVETDAAKVHQILTDELHAALEQIDTVADKLGGAAEDAPA